MTIGTSNRNDAVGNDAATVYPYGFKVFAASDLEVKVRDTANVETTLTYPTDFAVSGVGSRNGGNVTLSNVGADWQNSDGTLISGYAITIRRVRPLTQTSDIRNQGGFFADVHEDTFDHLVMIDQQQQDELDRSLKLPTTEDGTYAATVIPAATTRANRILAFDGSGNPTTLAANVTVVAVRESAHVATAGQTVVALSFNYVVGVHALSAYVNGLRAQIGVDFIETDAATITFLYPLALNDRVVVFGGQEITGSGALASSLITWLRAAVGAVTITLFEWLTVQSVHAKEFGVSGDGTDESTKLQAALNAVPAGGKLKLGRGTFKHATTLNVPDAVTVVGQGMDVTILSHTGNGNDGVNLSGSALSQGSKKGLRDLSVAGNALSNSGVAMSYVSYCTLKNVSVHGFLVGIPIEHGNENSFVHVFADSNRQDGWWFGSDANNITCIGCEGVSNTRAGMYAFGCNQVSFHSGALEANGYGAMITSAVGTKARGVTISQSYLEGNTTREVQAEDGGGGAPRGLNLIGNEYTFIAGKAAQAVRLISVDGFKELGGVFDDRGGQYTNSLYVDNAGTITGDICFDPTKDTSTGGPTAAGNQYFRDETRLRRHAGGQFTVAGGAISASRTFGVTSITYIGVGVYEITLKKAPNGGTDFEIECSAENGAAANLWLSSPGIPSSSTVFRIATSSVSGVLADARTVHFSVYP